MSLKKDTKLFNLFLSFLLHTNKRKSELIKYEYGIEKEGCCISYFKLVRKCTKISVQLNISIIHRINQFHFKTSKGI